MAPILLRDTFIYEPFANDLQIASHEAKIKEKTLAGHWIQIFLMFSDETQMVFMVLVYLHYIYSHEIRNCTLIDSSVICRGCILHQNS